MKKLSCSLICLVCFIQCELAQTVNIIYQKNSPAATYAASMLKKALLQKGYALREGQADYTVTMQVNADKLSAESYVVAPEQKNIVITGGDERGMIYGTLAVAEEIRNGTPVQHMQAGSDHPHYQLRAIKFDLPWDTYRHSYALDQHIATCRDTSYWKGFLDMMVENRFNALSLWNLHPYPFMIRAKNFPEACPFTDTELKEWQQLLQLFSGWQKSVASILT